MSPDSNSMKMSDCNSNQYERAERKTDCENSTETSQPSSSVVRESLLVKSHSGSNIGNPKLKDTLSKMPVSNSRERKNVSPIACLLNENFIDPQSPSSSSSTSQATSANDATFEPTIEMMVNDFDDEQTLNEEEALACLESQDPDEEIDTLKKESEMPLEELLAKYRALPPLSPPVVYSEQQRKKSKKSHKVKQKQKHKPLHSTQTTEKQNDENLDCMADLDNSKHAKAITDNAENIETKSRLTENEINVNTDDILLESVAAQEKVSENILMQNEIPKVRRSHLLDLYPEGTFDSVVVGNESVNGNSKEIFYGGDDDEEDEEIDEEDEDYKKKVMIGTSYQATIPVGLSQYGDILPYENEDKLIWEPSQVSEREVEEYLIKIRDIKANQQNEINESSVEINSDNQLKENGKNEKNIENVENNSLLANIETSTIESTATAELDNQAVVKDNEQALHLLVQCGYDFNEALRRKRLNALPLTDCMSLWSEEECHKFEEGIQKYGKDFLRIRQNQVRTRTMRELVQFYYLWKKSERRDHNFANADTVDHMDIYLNEDNEYGSNPSVITPLCSPGSNNSNSNPTTNGKTLNTSQKNISIMTTTASSQGATNSISEKNISNTVLQQHLHQSQLHKRRAHGSSINLAINDCNGENGSTTLPTSLK